MKQDFILYCKFKINSCFLSSVGVFLSCHYPSIVWWYQGVSIIQKWGSGFCFTSRSLLLRSLLTKFSCSYKKQEPLCSSFSVMDQGSLTTMILKNNNYSVPPLPMTFLWSFHLLGGRFRLWLLAHSLTLYQPELDFLNHRSLKSFLEQKNI
jgi:hypothetical protein